MRTRIVFVAVLAAIVASVAIGSSACGILGISVACNGNANCPAGVCVDGTCRTDVVAEGEGEGAPSEGEGEGAPGEGEGEGGATGEGEGEGGATGEGEGEGGATGEGEGEGEGGATGEGEGEGEGGPPNDCNDTVFVPAGITPDFVVAHGADAAGGRCFTTITAAFVVVPAGSVVFLAPGTYDEATETFPLSPPSGITLVGSAGNRGAGTVVTAHASTGSNGDTLQIVSNSGTVVIDGIQIGAGPDPGRLVDVELGDLVVQNCTFRGVGTAHIVAIGLSSSIAVTNSELFANNGTDAFFVSFTGAGSVSIADSTLHLTAIGNVFGSSSAPVALSIDHVTSTLDDEPCLIDEIAGHTSVTNSTCALVVSDGFCQGGMRVETGSFTMRSTTLSGYNCQANAEGAIDVTALHSGDAAPQIDLGTAANPGGNTFASNSIDVAVHYASTASELAIDAVGNTWSAADPCAHMALQNDVTTGNIITVAVDSGQACTAP